MHELKSLLEMQNKAFTDFRTKNDARLSALESKGTVDPILEEMVSKASKGVSQISARIAEIEKKMNRPGGNSTMNIKNTEQQKSFENFLRTGVKDENFSTKSMSIGTGSEGGYAVPSDLDSNLSSFLYDACVMRQLATVVTSFSADYKVAVNIGGLASGWVGEKDGRPETGSPEIALTSAPTGELYANPAATQWMIDDAGFNLTDWLMGEIEAKFASMEGGAFVSGDGNNKPKGFLAYPSSTDADDTRAFGTLRHKVAASATVIDPDELIDLTANLRGVYRKGAVWMMNSTTAAVIRKLKDTTTGQYMWQTGLQSGQPAQLLGYPLHLDEAMPDIATGKVPITFGNFKLGYRIIDRTPLNVLRDSYTNKPYVHFYSTKRVSGMLIDSNAIRLLKMA
ncbi:MAG: hypothetical protein ACD_75C01456G0006 [uncultured bacterium]|nr:MAG: hypothetical protein ACD_75C01456G0006 [uncultured bacterium]HBG18830.1 phage major capsid protein [Desulfobulbaceae bacterium]